jgi:predicted DNA-binding transcriptional regulator AlpA
MPARTPQPRDARAVAERTAVRAEFAAAPSDALFDVRMVAVVVCTTPKTLETWRSTGRGPAVTRLGSRAIRYRKRDVETWLSGAPKAKGGRQ